MELFMTAWLRALRGVLDKAVSARVLINLSKGLDHWLWSSG